jgi:lysine 2,3-aminomutase
MISQSERMTIFRNYEGVIARYIEPEDTSSLDCPEDCTICEDRKARGLDQPKVGLEKLFADEAVSLEPSDLERVRRKEN